MYFKLWIIVLITFFAMVITMLSGTGDGLTLGSLHIKPVSGGAIAALFMLLERVLYPLVRDVIDKEGE